ncbi:MAG: alpha-hydroxy acid oxidase [Burkholderiaceae bacterium]
MSKPDPSSPNPTGDSLAERFVALQEFIPAARERLSNHAWGYLSGATETETTQLRNRQALDSLAIRPRVLNDVSQVTTATRLFDRPARLPVLLCPIGGLESFDALGAKAVASAAASFGVPMMLSSVSQWSMNDLIEHCAPSEQTLSLIYQLYVREAPEGIDAVMEQAKALKLPAFCFTVDSSVYSRRERDIVARYVKPWRATGEGDAKTYQASFSWDDLARIRSRHDIPLILKGIATAEDAERAVEHGVDWIYVSNHGGRQLDHGQGSMAVLPEVTKAVRGRARILVDGGFCRGTDLVKALALGAEGVGLGRMMCVALAAAGAPGIERMLELLETEYEIALALAGVTSAAELNAAFIAAEQVPVSPVSAFSAFPLLSDQDLSA